MCCGIRMPPREIGLLPGGYGITSPCSKILWNEEDIVLVSCPENDASFSHYAVSYSLFGNPRLSYVALRQWFSTGGYCTPKGTFGNLWRVFDCQNQEWFSGHWASGILLNFLQRTSQTPTTKNYPAQDVSAVEAENPDLMFIVLWPFVHMCLTSNGLQEFSWARNSLLPLEVSSTF